MILGPFLAMSFVAIVQTVRAMRLEAKLMDAKSELAATHRSLAEEREFYANFFKDRP